MAADDLVIVVAARSDVFAARLVRYLHAKSAPTFVCEPEDLVDLPIVLDPPRLKVNGASPRAVVWRVTPAMSLSASIAAPDKAFADAEVAAVWLCALGLPAIYAVNRYPASVWYGGLHWSAWRSWLRERSVPVSALHLGIALPNRKQRWVPFHSASATGMPDATAAAALGIATSSAEPALSVIAVAGQLLHATPSMTMRAAAAALNTNGVVLARLTLDGNDRIISIDATPEFEDNEQLNLVVSQVTDNIYARLLAW